MVEANDSWLRQQHSLWESSASLNCMIAPFENRQHEFLPASINPCRVSANVGLSGMRFSGLPELGTTFEANCFAGSYVPHSCTPFHTLNQHIEAQTSPFLSRYAEIEAQTSSFLPRYDEKPSTYEVPCPQQKRFLIFDKSGNETKLIFSSLSPQLQDFPSAQSRLPDVYPQCTPANTFGGHPFMAQRLAKKVQQPSVELPISCEESGENEIVDEGSDMPEDTEELNALLYSDDDEDDENGDFAEYNDVDDDVVSTGQSPLDMERGCEKQELVKEFNKDEVACSSLSSKRRKALDSGYYNVPLVVKRSMSGEDIHAGDLICALDDGVGPTARSKRPRKDNIRDTLKVLETIIPGVKSKEPLIILDEAINYLKRLKCDAKTMFAEDPVSSSCSGA